MPPPVAFLCHASENKQLAERIATSLYENGVPTFFDKWEIAAGDSIVRKIEHGLGSCTHFIALMTPECIEKPWVKAEMDAGFVRRVEGTSKFIPLRYNLPAERLPSLFKPLYSPEITDERYEEQIKALVHDIYDISRRPPLGEAPQRFPTSLLERTGFSEAALRIAQYFVKMTKNAHNDPNLTIKRLGAEVSLSRDDVVDGLDELERVGAVSIHKVMTGSGNHHGLETRQAILGHKSGSITTHYSAAELRELLEAMEFIATDNQRESHALTLLKRRAG